MPKLSRRWTWVLVPMLGALAFESLQDTLLRSALPVEIHLLLEAAVLLGGAYVVAGTLFRRFDLMTAALLEQKEELEARSTATAALQRVALVGSGLRDLDRVLDTVADQARRLLGADVALVCLANDVARLAPRAQSGPAEAFHPGPASCPHPDTRDGACPLLIAPIRGDPSMLERGTGPVAGAPLCRFVDPAFLGSAVAVPLRVGERILGTLAVAARRSQGFGSLELATLEGLASMAAVAIDNARLYRRVRELGMIEERNRIARELHDGLAQVLAYVGAKSEAAVALLDSGRPTEARTQLRELGQAARSVYVDLREAILGLSSPLEPGQGIVGAIRDYAARYSEAAKLPTEVVAAADAEATRLAPAAEAQALRIVQEALTNVRKHAAAHRVVVTARRDGDELLLEVRDDGRGFDPSVQRHSDWPQFGITTMHERAASVGGSVQIASAPGSGTVVRVHLPVPAEQ